MFSCFQFKPTRYYGVEWSPTVWLRETCGVEMACEKMITEKLFIVFDELLNKLVAIETL